METQAQVSFKGGGTMHDFLRDFPSLPKEQLVTTIRENLSSAIGMLPTILTMLGVAENGAGNSLTTAIPLLAEVAPQVFDKQLRLQTGRVLSELSSQLSEAANDPNFYRQILDVIQRSKEKEEKLSAASVDRISTLFAGLSEVFQDGDLEGLDELRDQVLLVVPDVIRILELIKAKQEKQGKQGKQEKKEKQEKQEGQGKQEIRETREIRETQERH